MERAHHGPFPVLIIIVCAKQKGLNLDDPASAASVVSVVSLA